MSISVSFESSAITIQTTWRRHAATALAKLHKKSFDVIKQRMREYVARVKAAKTTSMPPLPPSVSPIGGGAPSETIMALCFSLCQAQLELATARNETAYAHAETQRLHFLLEQSFRNNKGKTY